MDPLPFPECPCEGAVSPMLLTSRDAAGGPQTKEKMIFRALQENRRRAGGFDVGGKHISTHPSVFTRRDACV